MKVLIIIFITLFTNLSIAQYQQKELLHLDVNNQTNINVHDISNDGFVILSKVIGTSKEYYITNVSNVEDRKLIFSSNDTKNDHIKFSGNDKLVIFRKKLNDKFVVHIYNIDNEQYTNIEHPNGDIVSASAVSQDIIIFQLRDKESVPKIYQYSSSNNVSRLITAGIGEIISPNGKWLFVKKIDEVANQLKVDLTEGKITKEQFLESMKTIQKVPPKSCIYNLNGELLLELVDTKNQIVDLDWSNDLQKIVFRELGDRGFHIIYFNEAENVLRIEKKYHFQGVQSVEGLHNFSLKPIWSPDGTQLLFVNSIEDGHNIISTDLWILEDNSYKLSSLVSGITNSIIKAGWQDNNVIYLEGDRNQTFFNVNGISFDPKKGE